MAALLPSLTQQLLLSAFLCSKLWDVTSVLKDLALEEEIA